MQSDNLDKKIKEAADHHHPAYDENAWNKMEKLLDTHLPQKKDDRRRVIFFLLFFLLLGSGAWLFVSKPWQPAKQVAANKENNSQITSSQTHTVKENSISEKKTELPTTQTTDNKENTGSTNEQKTNTQLVSPGITTHQYTQALRDVIKDRLKKTVKANTVYQKDQPSLLNNEPGTKNTVANETAPVKDDQMNNRKQNDINTPDTKNISQNTISPVKTDEPQKTDDKTQIKPTDDNKKDQTVTSVTPLVVSKNSGKNKKNNFFSLSASVGPDISKVGSSSTGRATLTYGAGVNYTFNRFTLRSGFYVAKKIYTANGSDYKLPYRLPSTIKLTTVDANCNVFEIPLDLTYSFGQKKNSNWYAGLGLSSYLMKKEKYTYLYTYTSGATSTHNDGVSNANKHYFSIANIMAGYTRQINNTISVSVEPYLKLPLTGIGLGKVHLNSGGVLFTLGVKPFQKKPAKK